MARSDLPMPDPHTAAIEAMYRAFNERDVDGAMAWLAPEVDWPNAATGERVLSRVLSFRGDTDEAWQHAARFFVRDLEATAAQQR